MARVGAAAAALLLSASQAGAAEAFFPDGAPPPTQVTRELSLKDAAQRGMVRLEGKGGDVGDQVAIEVTHRKVRGPITVTIRAEFTTARATPEILSALADVIAPLEQRTEAELNRRPNRTSAGDPVRFKVEFTSRAPDAAPLFNHHQITIINPRLDLTEPDPGYRSNLNGFGIPNRFGESRGGTFSVLSLDAATMAHESLHLAGLDDRYTDFYRVGGRDYPLPTRGMSRSELAAFARGHRPRLPGPPRGKTIVKNIPGTDRCDAMGTGFQLECRRISQRDLDFLDSQAAVQVVAEPGDLLLNKDGARQNFGIGFRSIVFAGPGSTTRANGISVYCIDKTRFLPLGSSFDVLGPAREVPGYEGLAALLELSGRTQTGLDEPPDGLLGAVWNVTDGTPLEVSGFAEEARALLAQAGVTENARPDGLPDLSNPNAGNPEAAAVSTGGVLPTVESTPSESPPQVRLAFASLSPNRLRAMRRTRADLLVSVGAEASLSVTIERRAGGRWRKVRALSARRVTPDTVTLPVSLGRLTVGRHRLMVSAVGPLGPPSTLSVPFTAIR